MIIVVANIKGGMSRTTISIMLSRAFSRAGKRVVLADTTWQGDSVRRIQLMQKEHGLTMPFEVREFPNNPFRKGYNSIEGGAELCKSIQDVTESMGPDGIVLVDTNSHHEDTLRSLDAIADRVVIPYDFSPTAFESTLRTINAFTAPTTVLPHQNFPAIDASDEDRLRKVVEKATYLSNSTLSYSEIYAKCDIPDSTFEYEQLASELIKQKSHVVKKSEDSDTEVQLNTQISLKHRRLLNSLSQNNGRTIKDLIEEALEITYL